MKSLFILTIAILGLVFSKFSSFAQEQETEQIEFSKNSIYGDLSAGLIIEASINYERQMFSGSKVNWYGRLGFGYSEMFWSAGGYGGSAAITMFTGKRNGHFECNAGVFAGVDKFNDFLILPIANIGFRYQKPTGGFIFRTYAGYLILGVSIGYAF